MLYATDGIDKKADFDKAMVGVASVWCVLLSRSAYLPAHLADHFSHSFSGTRVTREPSPLESWLIRLADVLLISPSTLLAAATSTFSD